MRPSFSGVRHPYNETIFSWVSHPYNEANNFIGFNKRISKEEYKEIDYWLICTKISYINY
jgi:hypothetical protein